MHALKKLSVAHLSAILIAITAVVYLPHVGNNFVNLDDPGLIYNNPAVQHINSHTLWHIATTYDPELYVPLTLFTYQLEYALFGASPWIFHFTNLVLHMFNVVLIFSLFRRFTGLKWPSFFAAAVFALHPINTEAVMWASARKDLLSSTFFLVALFGYDRFCKDREKTWYKLSIFAFLCSLMAKVSTVSFPLLLLVWEWKHNSLLSKQAAKRTLPFFGLSVIFGIIALLGKQGNLGAFPLTSNITLGFKSFIFYIQKMLYPNYLTAVYPQETEVLLRTSEFFVPAILCIGLVITTLIAIRKWKPGAVVFLMIGIIFAPNIFNFWKNGFVFFASDRYAYLVLFAVLLLLLTGYKTLEAQISNTFKKGISGILCVAFLLFGSLSYAQARTWQNSETLYLHTLKQYPTSALALANLGSVLYKQERYDEAKHHLQTAIDLHSNLVSARIAMGHIEREEGNFGKAKELYKDAVRAIDERPIVTSGNIAAYYFLAQMLERDGRYEQALEQYTAAIERSPHLAESYYNKGLLLQKMHRYSEATEAFSQAVDMQPLFLDARYHLADTLGALGRLPEAKEQLEFILSYDPSFKKARFHLEQIERLIPS